MSDLDKALQRLEQLRAEILELHEVRGEASAVVKLDQSSTGRLSRVDSLQRQAMAQHGQRQALARLRSIDAAVRRCHDGTYGLCIDCDEPIDERRLEVDPAAALCIDCASQRE
ncbi:MAG: TraR/DksA C4-type zinc finger protein [Gammaproteobacteria bacterium]|nr:TraR/DksA C4-type zinc finger protein [Gammaproteobacteria bacterium]